MLGTPWKIWLLVRPRGIGKVLWSGRSTFGFNPESPFFFGLIIGPTEDPRAKYSEPQILRLHDPN